MVSWLLPPVLSLILLTFVGVPAQQTPTPACASIAFDYFQTAVYDTVVEIEWQTSCEAYQPSEHRLRRAADLGGPWTPLVSITSRGTTGGFYQFHDIGLPPGVYYYRLDITDPSGGQLYVQNIPPDTGYDPVLLGAWTPVATRTDTGTPPPGATSTDAPSATPTSGTPILTPGTPTPTATASGMTDTPTPGPSPTPVATQLGSTAGPPTVPPTRPFSGPTSTPRLAPSPIASITRTTRPTFPPPPFPTARGTFSPPTAPSLPLQTIVSPLNKPTAAATRVAQRPRTNTAVARTATPDASVQSAPRSLGWTLLGVALVGIVGMAVLGYLVLRGGQSR
jgi:hypothetical protein